MKSTLINQDHYKQLFELKIATKKMRDLQKKYFKTRDYKVLTESKSQEKRVDEMINNIDNPSLF